MSINDEDDEDCYSMYSCPESPIILNSVKASLSKIYKFTL